MSNQQPHTKTAFGTGEGGNITNDEAAPEVHMAVLATMATAVAVKSQGGTDHAPGTRKNRRHAKARRKQAKESRRRNR